MLGAAEQVGEAGRAVEARPAQPVDAPVPPDERRRAAVAEEGVILDGERHRRAYPTLPGIRRLALSGQEHDWPTGLTLRSGQTNELVTQRATADGPPAAGEVTP